MGRPGGKAGGSPSGPGPRGGGGGGAYAGGGCPWRLRLGSRGWEGQRGSKAWDVGEVFEGSGLWRVVVVGGVLKRGGGFGLEKRK